MSREAAGNIRTASAGARIILAIRNPADAAVSLFHQLRDGFREDQTRFEAAWALQEARARGERLPPYCPEPRQLQYREVYLYHDQIVRYLEGADDLVVVEVDLRGTGAALAWEQ